MHTLIAVLVIVVVVLSLEAAVAPPRRPHTLVEIIGGNHALAAMVLGAVHRPLPTIEEMPMSNPRSAATASGLVKTRVDESVERALAAHDGETITAAALAERLSLPVDQVETALLRLRGRGTAEHVDTGWRVRTR